MDENNNVYTHEIKYTYPELEVLDISHSPIDITEGDQVYFKIAVKNSGVVDIKNKSFSVNVILDGKEFDNVNIMTIKSGETVFLNIKKDWIAEIGSHSITVLVDKGNNIMETDETNNTFIENIIVKKKTDLIVSDISYSSEVPKMGDKVAFKATIKNIGDTASPVGKAHRVGFKVDNSKTIFWSDNYLWFIEPGESVTVTANWGDDGNEWLATSGEHTITAIVNDTNIINETNITNNEYSERLDVSDVRVLNPEDDYDNDGLINRIEFENGTDVMCQDTDGDGINDSDELKLGSDPLNPDTDGDGILDGNEIKLKKNLLIKDENPFICRTISSTDESVIITAHGDLNVQAAPFRAIADDNILLKSTEGVLGGVDISLGGQKMDFAEISFNYDISQLNGIEEESLTVFWLDKQKRKLVPVESKVDTINKKVSCNVTHFSCYYYGPNNGEIPLGDADVVFVIDQSGSVTGSDAPNYRIKSIKRFAEDININNSRVGIIEFSGDSRVVQELTGEKDSLYSAINNMKNGDGSTNVGAGLSKVEELYNDSYNFKMVVLLSDGGNNQGYSDPEVVNIAKNLSKKGIKVNSVLFGSEANENLMRDIAYVGGGFYFHLKSAEEIDLLYGQILTMINLGDNGSDGYNKIRMYDLAGHMAMVNPGDVGERLDEGWTFMQKVKVNPEMYPYYVGTHGIVWRISNTTSKTQLVVTDESTGKVVTYNYMWGDDDYPSNLLTPGKLYKAMLYENNKLVDVEYCYTLKEMTSDYITLSSETPGVNQPMTIEAGFIKASTVVIKVLDLDGNEYKSFEQDGSGYRIQFIPPKAGAYKVIAYPTGEEGRKLQANFTAKYLANSVTPYYRDLNFNGSNSINIGSGGIFKPVDEVTIAMWVKPALSQKQNATIISCAGSNPGYGYALQQDGSNTNRYVFTCWDTKNRKFTTDTIGLKADTWQHIAVQKTGATLRFYVNGVCTSVNEFSTDGIGYNSLNVYLGTTASNPGAQNFTGELDDVVIWERGLNESEIRDVAANGALTNTYGIVNFQKNNKVNHDVQIVNNSLDFSGSNSVNLGSSESLKPSNEFTLSTWVRSSSQQSQGAQIIGFANGGYRLEQGNDKNNFIFQVWNGTGWVNTVSAELNAGSWQHIAITKSQDDILFYVNGELKSVKQFRSGIKYDSQAALYLGTRFKGSMHNVGIWSRVLTEYEIRKVIKDGPDSKTYNNLYIGRSNPSNFNMEEVEVENYILKEMGFDYLQDISFKDANTMVIKGGGYAPVSHNDRTYTISVSLNMRNLNGLYYANYGDIYNAMVQYLVGKSERGIYANEMEYSMSFNREGSIYNRNCVTEYLKYINSNPEHKGISKSDFVNLMGPQWEIEEAAARKSRGNPMHTLLDVLGLVPVFGMVADGVNVFLYLVEKDHLNACISALGLVEFIGYGAAGYRIISRGAANLDNIRLLRISFKNSLDSILSIKTCLKTKKEALFEIVEETKDQGTKIWYKLRNGNEVSLPKGDLTPDEIICSTIGCFTGDTIVHTSEGQKRINQVKQGDYVLAKDVKTGEIDYKKVNYVYLKHTNEIIHLVVDNEVIKTTATHLFFTDCGWWKSAENIKVILVKTRNRINALPTVVLTKPRIDGTAIVPEFSEIADFKNFLFKIDAAETPDLKTAVESVLNNLKKEFPDYTFKVTYGG